MFHQKALLITKYESGIALKQLASEFKICYQTACKIIRDHKKSKVRRISSGPLLIFILFLSLNLSAQVKYISENDQTNIYYTALKWHLKYVREANKFTGFVSINVKANEQTKHLPHIIDSFRIAYLDHFLKLKRRQSYCLEIMDPMVVNDTIGYVGIGVFGITRRRHHFWNKKKYNYGNAGSTTMRFYYDYDSCTYRIDYITNHGL